jgi:RNA polymerase sporulation-specific sigma factor
MQVRALYEKMRKVLKGREKIVIEMRYGLIDGEEVTQREIADILGISRSYVSRIEKKALGKLSREIQA